MKDEGKTKEQLLDERKTIRDRLTELKMIRDAKIGQSDN